MSLLSYPFRRLSRWAEMLLIASLCLVFFSRAHGGDDRQIAVVVNNQVSEFELNSLELRAIFSVRRRSWSDGSPIKIFVLPDSHPTHQLFCQTLIRSYAYVLRDHWDRMTFSGTGVAPTVIDSEEEMRRKIASTPGSIGYILISDDNGNPPGMQTVYPSQDSRQRRSEELQ